MARHEKGAYFLQCNRRATTPARCLTSWRCDDHWSSSVQPCCDEGIRPNTTAANDSIPTSLDTVALGAPFSVTRAVGLKVLKHKLSAYLQIAASAEHVLATDRYTLIAELGPPQGG